MAEISARSATYCTICKNASRWVTMETLVCGHFFHKMCSKKWLGAFGSCSLCPVTLTPRGTNNGENSRHDSANVPETGTSTTTGCTICKNTSRWVTMEPLACGHSFHKICAMKCLKIFKTCPLCQTDATVPVRETSNQENTDDNSSNTRGTSVRSTMTCTLCLNASRWVTMDTLVCGHSFHKMCIQKCLRRSNACPLCRAAVSPRAVSNQENNTIISRSVPNWSTGSTTFTTDCSICENSSRWVTMESLVCGHSFHKMCVRKCLRRHNACPQCHAAASLQDISNRGGNPMNTRETRRRSTTTSVDCSICLDTSQSGVMIRSTCGHSFHSACIQGWMNVSNTCPLCREIVAF